MTHAVLTTVIPTMSTPTIFARMADMTTTVEFDMLAHFDRIFATGTNRFGPPDMDRLEAEIQPVLRALADRNRTLEINTRFLCR